jgi:hypothetical protein
MVLRSAGIIRLTMLAGCADVNEPFGGCFRKVSQVVHFPDYYVVLGTFCVRPDRLLDRLLEETFRAHDN